MDNIISVKNLKIRHYSKDSHVDAIKDISFDVKAGEFISICGLNRSGKTSLMSALNGLIPHFNSAKMKGDVLIDGLNTKENPVSKLSCKIGFVFDNPFNQISYTTETVRHEIAFGLCNLGIPKEEMETRVEEIAQLVGITDLLEKSPLALSGGQLQRLAIASVIVMKPKVLMLDDCTSQLDPLGATQIYDLVEKLNKLGMTILSVDHDMERVCKYSDRIIVLQDGNMKFYDTPQKVLSDSDLEKSGIKPHDSFLISHELQKMGVFNDEISITFSELEKNLYKMRELNEN